MMDEEEIMKKLRWLIFGEPRVYNFTVVNSEKVFKLHGFAKHLVIHNAGSSDVVISFPNSAGKYYTIPSGNNNANPLIIPNIENGKVDNLILRSNGVQSVVEVVALLWESGGEQYVR